MAAHHDCDFRARNRVLADSGVGIENDAEGAFGVLVEGERTGEEVAEAVNGEERGVAVVEVYDHYGYGGGEG